MGLSWSLAQHSVHSWSFHPTLSSHRSALLLAKHLNGAYDQSQTAHRNLWSGNMLKHAQMHVCVGMTGYCDIHLKCVYIYIHIYIPCISIANRRPRSTKNHKTPLWESRPIANCATRIAMHLPSCAKGQTECINKQYPHVWYLYICVLFKYVFECMYTYIYIPYHTIPIPLPLPLHYHTITIPLPYHTNTIPLPLHYHTITIPLPYHTITITITIAYHTIPHHTIPYHTITLHYITYIDTLRQSHMELENLG